MLGVRPISGRSRANPVWIRWVDLRCIWGRYGVDPGPSWCRSRMHLESILGLSWIVSGLISMGVHRNMGKSSRVFGVVGRTQTKSPHRLMEAQPPATSTSTSALGPPRACVPARRARALSVFPGAFPSAAVVGPGARAPAPRAAGVGTAATTRRDGGSNLWAVAWPDGEAGEAWTAGLLAPCAGAGARRGGRYSRVHMEIWAVPSHSGGVGSRGGP